MEEQDLWFVKTVLQYKEWPNDKEEYFILRTESPEEPETAAKMAAVQCRYRMGLPNGEYPHTIIGTAYRNFNREQFQVGERILVFDPSVRDYRYTTVTGQRVDKRDDKGERLSYDWQEERWNGVQG